MAEAVFASADLAEDAVYYPPGEAVGSACRVLVRRERQDMGLGAGLAVIGPSVVAEVRSAEVPRVAAKARLVLGGATYEVQPHPEQDQLGIWHLGLEELRP